MSTNTTTTNIGTTNIGKRVKLILAGVGGSAVLAMSVFGVALAQEQQSDPALMAKSNVMNIGSSATTTTAPATVEATQMAVPAIKGPAPLPSEQQAAE